jgi:amino acid transporter
VLTFIVGGLALLAFVLAIPDLSTAMKSSVALSYVLESNLGQGVAKGFIVLAVLAIFVCGTAVQATVSRLLYSFGRDRKIPGSNLWTRVSEKYETPVAAILFSGAFTIALTMSASALTYIVNICTIGIYLSYLSIALGALIARKRGWDSTAAPWNLKKWGLPINILAALWGIGVIFNLCWPRTPDAPWYVNYSLPLLIGTIVVIGGLYYFTMIRPREIAELREWKPKFAMREETGSSTEQIG